MRAVKRSGETDKFIRHKNKQSSEKQAAKAKQTDRARERLEARAVDKPWEGWELDLVFEPGERSGAVVARLDAAVVHRGSFTLGPIDLEVEWQERIAIVGPNGSGKTTLLRTILGRAAARRGLPMGRTRECASARSTRLASCSRPTGRSSTRSARGPVSSSPRRGRSSPSSASTPTPSRRPPAALSPGERSRAILGALAAGESNCLVLDEPTNHLDLPAIEQLEAALDTYTGTLLLVTHDRRLLERVDITRTLDL